MVRDDIVRINANLEISGETLQRLVRTAKAITVADARGHYKIDTAELLSAMISRFLVERDFDAYVAEHQNYPMPANTARRG